VVTPLYSEDLIREPLKPGPSTRQATEQLSPRSALLEDCVLLLLTVALLEDCVLLLLTELSLNRYPSAVHCWRILRAFNFYRIVPEQLTRAVHCWKIAYFIVVSDAWVTCYSFFLD